MIPNDTPLGDIKDVFKNKSNTAEVQTVINGKVKQIHSGYTELGKMCIRDRDTSDKAIVIDWYYKSSGVVHYVKSVSYTHLDVYKRKG